MQISGSHPTQNTLQLSLTSETQRESLLGSLKEGQTIQARVVDELSTGRWAIRFMGHTLIAESRLALKPGQVVETRVQDVGPPLTLSISGRPGSSEAAVRTALQQLGLGQNPTNRAILASLIRNGLSIERQEVQSLRDFLTGLGNSPLLDDLDELVDRILFLRSKGVPVTPDTLSAFWSSAPSGTLGSLIEGLADLMRALDKRGDVSKTRLAEMVKVISEGTDQLDGQSVRNLLDRLGLDLEARLAGEKPIDSLKAALLELMSSSIDLSTEEQGQLSHFLRFINTLQVSSLPGDGSDPLYLQIPVPDGNSLSTADIQISRGGEDGSVDPQRLTLSVQVTLSALGSVKIELSSYEGVNTCGVRVEDRPAYDAIASEIDQLREALRRSGYPVSEVRLGVEEAGRAPEEVTKPRIGVDFKA